MAESHPPLGKYFVSSFDQGDADYPIVSVRKDTRAGGYRVEPDYTPCPGQIPGIDLSNHILTDISPSGGDQFAYWTYRILPGAIAFGSEMDPQTNVNVWTQTRDIRARKARSRAGIYTPDTKQISSIEIANPGVLVVPDHGFFNGESVTVAGCTTTSTINGVRTATVLDANRFSVGVNVTVVTALGAVRRTASIYREIQRKDATISVQIDSQIDTSSLAAATKVFYTAVDHDWPQKLAGVDGLRSSSVGIGSPIGTFPNPCQLTFKTSDDERIDVAIRMLRYWGLTKCKITRSYSYGAPTPTALNIAILTSGEILLNSWSMENSATLLVDAGGSINGEIIGVSQRFGLSAATIPFCLSNGVTAVSYLNGGAATADILMTPSTPPALTPSANYDWNLDEKTTAGLIGLFETTLVQAIQPTF